MRWPTIGDVLTALGFGLAFIESYVAEKKTRYPDAAPLWDALLEDIRAAYQQEVASAALGELFSQLGQFVKTWRSEAPPSPSDLA